MSEYCFAVYWFNIPFFLQKFAGKLGHSQLIPGASRQSRDNFWQVQSEVLINFMESGFLQFFLGLQFKAANENTQQLSISTDKKFQGEILELC